jgi:hypothetical protein
VTRPRDLDDARLAEAWSSGSKGSGCPDDLRFLDLAQGRLDPREVETLLDHTASCADCALALQTAAAIHDASGLATGRADVGPSLWGRLAATLLRPEAALAYLLLAVLAIPAYRALQPAPAGRPAVAAVVPAHVVGLESETVTRGAASPAPVAIDTPAGETIVLRVFVERDDLVAGAPLRVTLTDAGRSLYEATRPADALDSEGRLDVAVDPHPLPAGTPLRLEVRSGESVVFARSIVLGSAVAPAR